MHRLLTFALVALLSVVLLPWSALGHPNHGRKVLGTVSAITAERLTLKDVKGKETAVVLTKQTKVVRAKQPADLAAVTPGTRVVVTVTTEKSQLLAQQIDITPASAAGPASH